MSRFISSFSDLEIFHAKNLIFWRLSKIFGEFLAIFSKIEKLGGDFAKKHIFLAFTRYFWRIFGEFLAKKGGFMRSINYKGERCTKRKLNKCSEIARTHDKLQTMYASILDSDEEVKEIYCNVVLSDFGYENMTTDFLCLKQDGEYMVRECVYRKKLLLPRTCKLLDASRVYWLKRGITDWAIVIEEEGNK